MIRVWIPSYHQIDNKVKLNLIKKLVCASLWWLVISQSDSLLLINNYQDLGKSYTVYRVEVTTRDGRYFSFEKRYSGFHDLFMKCRERYSLNTNFPPKKLSNSTAKVPGGLSSPDSDWVLLQVLDSRRAGLELYLQSLASVDPLPTELLEFLNLQDIRINQNNITSGNRTGNIHDIYWTKYF